MQEESISDVRSPRSHARCFLCGTENPKSLRLQFACVAEGTVAARFRAHPSLQGYDDTLHGGVVCALLDAAMTHSLFSHSIEAVTGDLHVRFLRSIPCDAAMEIRGSLLLARPPLFQVRAEITIDGRVHAWGEGKFVRRKASP